MNIKQITANEDLSSAVEVLNISHQTVAKNFGFTKETNPTNSAFIDIPTLKSQLVKGVELFLMWENNKAIACIAVEQSSKNSKTFYIEKVSVVPDYRNRGIGKNLMDFAINQIENYGGKVASIAIIDSNTKLKKWYISRSFNETGSKIFDHLPFKVCFLSRAI